MKTPGALPLVVLLCLPRHSHLDQVLHQVQGASKALEDLVHKGDSVSYSQTLTLEQDRSLGCQIRVKAGELSQESRLQVSSRFRNLLNAQIRL